MGDFLLGKETSGTPTETKGATGQMGGILEKILSEGGLGGLAAELERMQTEGLMSSLGFDPATLGLEGVIGELLASPSDTTSGLFAAMKPFEERETERQVGGMRNMFGTAGGRFSRNLMTGEGRLRGELSEGYARTREQSLLQAGGQRSQTLMGLLNAIIGARSASTNMMAPFLQFMAPGAPQYQQGALGEILGSVGSLAGLKILTDTDKSGAAAAAGG